jgi:hypothetical protein
MLISRPVSTIAPLGGAAQIFLNEEKELTMRTPIYHALKDLTHSWNPPEW